MIMNAETIEGIGEVNYIQGTESIVKFGPFTANRCYFTDCLKALPLIPEQAFDFCLTDPPWGSKTGKVEYLGSHHGRKLETPGGVHYDNISDEKFHKEWFRLGLKVSRKTILCLSKKSALWYMREKQASDLIIINLTNGKNESKVARYNNISLYPVYLREKVKKKLVSNIFEYTIRWGFIPHEKYIHKSPKGSDLWSLVLGGLGAENAVDPFCGSGCIGETCEGLGIPWLGFEIMEEYIPDIEKRVNKGIETRKLLENTSERTVIDL